MVIDTPEAAVELRPGDYGLVPVGVPHSWRNHPLRRPDGPTS